MRCATLLLLPLALACTTTVDSIPAGIRSLVIPRADPTGAWRVLDGGRQVGWLVRFETPGDAGQFLFSVRNVHQQDMGLIDALGRFYRFRPHADEPEWLGSGTVGDGVRYILGASAGVELREVDLSEATGAPNAAPAD